jgi:hypothetical protein
MSLISMLARVLKMTLIQAVQNGPDARQGARKANDESGRMKTEISAFSFHNSCFLTRWAVFNSLLPLIEKIDLT